MLIDLLAFWSDFPYRLSKLNHFSVSEAAHERGDLIQAVAA